MNGLVSAGQPLHVLEGARRVRAELPIAIDDGPFCKRHGRRSLQYLAACGQGPLGRTHKARFHFNGYGPHIAVQTTRRVCHRDIQQGHARTAVGDQKLVQVRRLRRVAELRGAVLHRIQLKAQLGNERYLGRKIH